MWMTLSLLCMQNQMWVSVFVFSCMYVCIYVCVYVTAKGHHVDVDDVVPAVHAKSNVGFSICVFMCAYMYICM